jgi:hypothetical protein
MVNAGKPKEIRQIPRNPDKANSGDDIRRHLVFEE